MLSKIGWRVVGGAAAGLAGAAARLAVGRGWRADKGAAPPREGYDPTASTSDSILWAAASAAAVELSRVAARRVAATGWTRAAGSAPPVKGRSGKAASGKAGAGGRE